MKQFLDSLIDWTWAIKTLSASRLHLKQSPKEKAVKAHMNNQQLNQNNDEIATRGGKLPYEPPAVTVMGKVEHLTALLVHGVPDLLSHGNIL